MLPKALKVDQALSSALTAASLDQIQSPANTDDTLGPETLSKVDVVWDFSAMTLDTLKEVAESSSIPFIGPAAALALIIVHIAQVSTFSLSDLCHE